jgi:hypothetical protein
MTDLEAALIELAEALEDCQLPYAVIGGLAVALSGEPSGDSRLVSRSGVAS